VHAVPLVRAARPVLEARQAPAAQRERVVQLVRMARQAPAAQRVRAARLGR